MGFYEQISKHYDYIFPVGDSQLKFIMESTGTPPKAVLDVACGTGGYTAELAKAGYLVAAVDIDGEMVRQANKKMLNMGVNAKVRVCDMKGLKAAFHTGFDCIFCIGNSIVHLGSSEEIKGALVQMYDLINNNGTVIIQIINFDRILKFGISELPVLKDEKIGLEFVRRYKLQKEKGIINFDTVLYIDNGKESFENSVELYPMTSSKMFSLLKEAGFANINFYGDFNYSEFNENSFMLVVKAGKYIGSTKYVTFQKS